MYLAITLYIIYLPHYIMYLPHYIMYLPHYKLVALYYCTYYCKSFMHVYVCNATHMHAEAHKDAYWILHIYHIYHIYQIYKCCQT